MVRKDVCVEAIVSYGSSRSARALLISSIFLGAVAVLAPERVHASAALLMQSSPVDHATWHLSVQPHKAATAKQTSEAGQFSLDSLPEYLVYVPKQCVGEKRCPLAVFLHGAGYGAEGVMDWQRPVADKYGIIVLAPTSVQHYSWDDEVLSQNQEYIDAALKQVLGKFAIDPDKIALIGRCDGGPPAIIWGGNNLDIFSRVVLISGTFPRPESMSFDKNVGPPNKGSEFFVVAGIPESQGAFQFVHGVSKAGHYVKHVVGFRGHEHQVEDYDFVGHWLKESWAVPNPANRHPPVVLDTNAVLTTDVLSRMRTFWDSFAKEPDSIRTTARRAYLREVLLQVGKDSPTAVISDMSALAATHPSVAADLAAAGFTGEQYDVYRVAFARAELVNSLRTIRGIIEDGDTNSILEKNAGFLLTHGEESDAVFWKTQIFSTP